MSERFHDELRRKMDEYVHDVYRLTKHFPTEERYGASSQLRRSALSVVLNYIEGFARRKRLVKINFFEISYGSLQESKYLLGFSKDEEWIGGEDEQKAVALAQEIAAMLWKTIEHLQSAEE